MISPIASIVNRGRKWGRDPVALEAGRRRLKVVGVHCGVVQEEVASCLVDGAGQASWKHGFLYRWPGQRPL